MPFPVPFDNPQYVVGQSGVATFSSPWVVSSRWRKVQFAIDWAAAASTDGTLSLQGSGDYRNGAVPAPAANEITTLTIPTAHGTWPTVGTAAANAIVIVENPPALLRVTFTRVTGGAAGQFNIKLLCSYL